MFCVVINFLHVKKKLDEQNGVSKDCGIPISSKLLCLIIHANVDKFHISNISSILLMAEIRLTT